MEKGGVVMADNESGLRKHEIEELRAEVERLRAEQAILQAELDKQKQRIIRRRFPVRRTLTWLFIVIGCAAAIVAPIAVWANRSFLDTNNFANIVAPLAANQTVARSLSDEVAGRLFARLEMHKHIKDALQEALPDKLDFLASPVAHSLQMLTQRITFEIITSPQFQSEWDRILRLAHSTAVRIIRSDRFLTVRESGEVVLNTRDLMGNVRSRLLEFGLRFLEKTPIPFKAGEVVLFTSSQLGKLKTSLELLDTLNWLLPLLALFFFAASIILSEDRRKTLMWLFVALAVAMAVSLMLVNQAERELLQEVRNPNNIGAVRIIWDRMTADLVRVDRIILALGIMGAMAFAVAGPYGWANWTRNKVKRYLPFQLKRQSAE
jgi:hypothetical protein